MYNENIINYYNSCKKDYQLLWKLDRLWAMHYAYLPADHKFTFHLASGIKEMNDQIAKRSSINKNSKVLDVGCGYGGTALHIAKKVGCQVTGITLVEEQAKTGNENIKKEKLDDKVKLLVGDYHHTNFPDNSFDMIYGLEAVCYADEDKFLKEMYRLLKPGGEIIIIDAFRIDRKYNEEEALLMKKWADGFAYKELKNVTKFIKKAEKIGFKNGKFDNTTKNILVTSKLLFLAHYPAKIVNFIGRILKTRDEQNRGNVIAAKYQYLSVKKGLWEYGFLSLKKPKN